MSLAIQNHSLTVKQQERNMQEARASDKGMQQLISALLPRPSKRGPIQHLALPYLLSRNGI